MGTIKLQKWTGDAVIVNSFVEDDVNKTVAFPKTHVIVLA